jgi:hypothetical protein
MRLNELERRIRERLDALGPAPRAESLHVLMLPDLAVEGTDRLPRQELALLSEPFTVLRRIFRSSVERRIPMRISVRRLLLGATVTGSLVLLPGPASAHVHGITPLLQCSVVPDNAGANQVDSTPAGAANGGPISGLIPATVGNSPLTGGDGGFTAPVQCP